MNRHLIEFGGFWEWLKFNGTLRLSFSLLLLFSIRRFFVYRTYYIFLDSVLDYVLFLVYRKSVLCVFVCGRSGSHPASQPAFEPHSRAFAQVKSSSSQFSDVVGGYSFIIPILYYVLCLPPDDESPRRWWKQASGLQRLKAKPKRRSLVCGLSEIREISYVNYYHEYNKFESSYLFV